MSFYVKPYCYTFLFFAVANQIIAALNQIIAQKMLTKETVTINDNAEMPTIKSIPPAMNKACFLECLDVYSPITIQTRKTIDTTK
jgi:hypothetical protein